MKHISLFQLFRQKPRGGFRQLPLGFPHGGAALLGALFAESERRGAAVLRLEVRGSNLAARRLYEKNGFETVGKRKNYYEKPTEDAILMSKFFQKEAE